MKAHPDRDDVPLGVLEFRDALLDRIGSRGLDGLYDVVAVEAEGNHYTVRKGTLGHGADLVAADDAVARFRRRRESPLSAFVKRREVDSALEKVPRLGSELGKRILESVVYLPEESRPQLDREEVAHETHLVADADPARYLEHL